MVHWHSNMCHFERKITKSSEACLSVQQYSYPVPLTAKHNKQIYIVGVAVLQLTYYCYKYDTSLLSKKEK